MSTYQEESSMEMEKQCQKNNLTTLQNNKNAEPIPFWSDDPNILLNNSYIFELFPSEKMAYEQKMNAVSRLVILLTVAGFLFSQNLRILVICAITLIAIFLLYNYQQQKKEKMQTKKVIQPSIPVENFDNPALDVLQKNGMNPTTEVFDTPSDLNPFSNVLMTDYDFNPTKRPAPPSYNADTGNTILDNAKQLVKNANPDQPDIADKLFKDLGDQLIFEQSMRPFFSNPGTTIPNDQTGFAEFCYGSMISCKEGNMFACARNLSRHST